MNVQQELLGFLCEQFPCSLAFENLNRRGGGRGALTPDQGLQAKAGWAQRGWKPRVLVTTCLEILPECVPYNPTGVCVGNLMRMGQRMGQAPQQPHLKGTVLEEAASSDGIV